MNWLWSLVASVVTRIFESWYHTRVAEQKGAADAEREGLQRAEAQEMAAKKIDAEPPPKDKSDDAFHPKYWRD